MTSRNGTSGPHSVVVMAGRGPVDPDTPLLLATDLGVVRGDGAFETLRLVAGRVVLLDAHLDRMTRSAQRLELALPPRQTIVDLVAEATRCWPTEHEGALRVVCTRGPEHGGEPTCYVTVAEVGPTILRQRRDGVRVVTANLGIATDLRSAAPWLLGGVKSLSYAMNMATLRWAAEQGADDALWLATDGSVLEAPTSTVLWLAGDALCTVPTDTGILPGTTAGHLLEHAAAMGLRAERRRADTAELMAADGVWLASSVRGVVEVTAVDGTSVGAAGHVTARLRQELDDAR